MNTDNKNGEKKETNNQINGKEICLLCGRKKQEKNPVCYACYQGYEKDRIRSVSEELKDFSILEWTLKKAKELQNVLKEELVKAQTEFNDFKNKVSDRAFKDVKGALAKAVPQEVFSEMLNGRRQKLWGEGNGDKLYGQLKCLELRVKNLPSFIEELEKKLAEREQKNSGQKPEEANEQ